MDLGTVLSAAQTLFSALQCVELKEALSIIGYKSRLEDLRRTVTTIKAVLRDAEAKQELSEQEQNLVEELKDAVFEADDLFDEFVTLAEQKQLLKTDGSHSTKVSSFFSYSTNPLSLAYRMSRGIKDVRKKLKAVAENSQFSFKINHEPIRKRRPETCSYVNEVEIIGREQDLEKIVGTLLASNDQSDVSFLSIVGIGGLGKTALAQLVYNDPRITDAFRLKMWTCVSDEDQKELDVKNILGKIFGRNQEGSTMEEVQSQVRAQLAGKKYLLVLDDVWTEKRDQWCKLVTYLIGEKRGSWIMVTTRSQKTATITGGLVHHLEGLSKENSWRLFENTAFTSQQLSSLDDELVKIGQKIVDGCAQVPLAIRVVGTLLYGQDKSKWQNIQKIGLANIRDDDNGIMPILRLSFHHLESPLKSCFMYCALFPKDFVIEKDALISYWMAQGYIVPFDNFQSIEDAGEEYFWILARRCFFQDIKTSSDGETLCKIHDLMHDVALSVLGKEKCVFKSVGGNVDKKVRHLMLQDCQDYTGIFQGKTHIRSYLYFIDDSSSFYQYLEPAEELVASCRYLRVLELWNYKSNYLPCCIVELLHLRYLELSYSSIVVLPKGFTKLYNLQTLILNGCSELKELPKYWNTLVKLRVLEMRGCDGLNWMPRDMGKLTCLQRLEGEYIVGGEGSCTSWKQWFYGLEELKTLNNLKGKLKIRIKWPKNAKNVVKVDHMREGLYLRSKEHLNEIWIDFKEEEVGGRMDDEGSMRLMEDLQPHPNLKELRMDGYQGPKMPGWVTLLPHLASLRIVNFKEVKYLPCLGNLRHLKRIYLENLPSLEYIEEGSTLGLGSNAEEPSFYPSLEILDLDELPEFKGWRRGVIMENPSNSNDKPQLVQQSLPCLSQLKELWISKCPELTCIPLCPTLETLTSEEFNKRIKKYYSHSITDEKVGKDAVENSKNSSSNLVPELKDVSINKVAQLLLLPIECFQSIQTLDISYDEELVNLPNYMQYLSALQTLGITYCKNLEEMPNWMPKLTSLQTLRILIPSATLRSRCERDPPGKDWSYIQHIPNIEFIS